LAGRAGDSHAPEVILGHRAFFGFRCPSAAFDFISSWAAMFSVAGSD
jgi:hypothetical protein